jgi:hypothetical protein
VKSIMWMFFARILYAVKLAKAICERPVRGAIARPAWRRTVRVSGFRDAAMRQRLRHRHLF